VVTVLSPSFTEYVPKWKIDPCMTALFSSTVPWPGDVAATRLLALASGEAARFHDPSRPYLHPEDLEIALDIDRFDFAVRIEQENGRPVDANDRGCVKTLRAEVIRIV
jgi:hypothetical protein